MGKSKMKQQLPSEVEIFSQLHDTSKFSSKNTLLLLVDKEFETKTVAAGPVLTLT